MASLDGIRTMFSESEAASFDGADEGISRLNGHSTFFRCWRFFSAVNVKKGLEFLREYVSGKNDKPSLYVENPLVDGEVMEGKWRQTGVKPVADKKRVTVVQALRRVFFPVSAAALSAMGFKRVVGTEVLDLFGLAEGTGGELAFVWEDLDPEAEFSLLAISAADLLTLTGGVTGTWRVAVTRFTLQGDDVGKFEVLFKRASFVAADFSTADLIDYTNYDTEKQGIRESWFNVPNTTDLTGVFSTSRTGYCVGSVSVAESGNGTLRVSRDLVHVAQGDVSAGVLSEEGKITLNAHGIETGVLDVVTVINEDMKLKSSAYTALPSGYTLVDTSEKLQGNGLWSKFYRYEKATWDNWTSTQPTRFKSLGVSNPSGNGKAVQRIAAGVPLANAVAAVENVAATAGYLVGSASLSEREKGEGVLSVSEAVVFDYGTSTVTAPSYASENLALGNENPSAQFVWERVSPTRIETVRAAAKLLANFNSWFTNAYPAGDGWGVRNVTVQRDADGAADVRATLGIPADGGTRTLETWGGTTDVVVSYSYVRNTDGLIIREIEYSTQYKMVWSLHDGEAWLDDMSDSYDLVSQYSGTDGGAGGKYLAKAVWISDEVEVPLT